MSLCYFGCSFFYFKKTTFYVGNFSFSSWLSFVLISTNQYDLKWRLHLQGWRWRWHGPAFLAAMPFVYAMFLFNIFVNLQCLHVVLLKCHLILPSHCRFSQFNFLKGVLVNSKCFWVYVSVMSLTHLTFVSLLVIVAVFSESA